MADAARRGATYEDILTLPEHERGEIIAGELLTQPRPGGPHAIVASELGMDLGAAYRRGRGGPGGWLIVDEPEVHHASEVMVPDLAGWLVDRLPPEARRKSHFDVVPDWVCEVFSVRTALTDRNVKGPAYARWGVQYLWYVEPRLGAVHAHALRPEGWLWLGTWTDGAARIPPFDAVAVDLTEIWRAAGGPEREESG